MGYTRDFLKGLGWIGAFRIGAKLIVFAKIIVAYRYLSPREVGLFGLCALALGLLEMLTETGINIILLKDDRPISYYLDTAFIVSIARGIVIGLVLFGFAFILPPFFRDSALLPLLLLVSVIPVIKGFINPAITSYIKELQYNREALLRIGLILIESLVAIVLVRIYGNAASLIYAMIVAAVAEVAYSYICIRQWPRLAFDRAVYHEIITPGKWVNAAGIVTYAEQNFDNVLVGRVLGASELGYYQTAFNLTRSLIAEVGTAFSQVLLPIYGRIVGDANRLVRAVRKLFLPAALLMLIPAIVLNLSSTQEWLLFFLQEKWRPALQLFFPLSLCAWLTGMNTLVNPLFIARNRIRELVGVYSVGLLLMLFGMYWFTHTYGLVGAAYAVLLSRIVLQPLFIWKTIRLMRVQSV